MGDFYTLLIELIFLEKTHFPGVDTSKSVS